MTTDTSESGDRPRMAVEPANAIRIFHPESALGALRRGEAPVRRQGDTPTRLSAANNPLGKQVSNASTRRF